MLVIKVVGDCPGCGGSACFGNCKVDSGMLFRGCKSCTYTETFILCGLDKKIVYLDQFFFSMDYRESSQKIVLLSQKVQSLVDRQLAVTPFSPVHRDEANLWRGYENMTAEGLKEHMKKRAKGSEFMMHGSVVRHQMLRAFDAFRFGENNAYSLEMSDVVYDDFNDWHDYLRVEVDMHRDFSDLQAIAKEKTTEDLLSDIELWRSSKSTFEEDRIEFSLQMVQGYWKSLINRSKQLADEDGITLAGDSILPNSIYDMIHLAKNEKSVDDPYMYVSDFLTTDYLRDTPYHFIATRILAALKAQVKSGAHTNTENIREKFGGFFFDVLHVATYAPYCDAIFVDNAMANLLADHRIRLTERYGTQVFSLSQASKFEKWLDRLESSATSEHRASVDRVYPGRWESSVAT